MCMKCPAQSRGDAGLLYYNLGSCVEDGCRWVQEEYSLAGFIAKSLKDRNLCPLLQIYGFHPGCIRWCTMHALNLGILFTVNGGGLMLLMDLLYFGPRTFEEQLDTAYKSFVGFCRQHKIHHSQPPFTRRSVLRKTGEVGLVAKAWNGRCVLRWLSHCLQDALVSNGDNDCLVLTTAATSSLAHFFSLMESSPRVLFWLMCAMIFAATDPIHATGIHSGTRMQ
ncbi:unnamed protein product [Cladocopium goreaui]|uniref:Uncharacterized protein n=1 Tax=Cladocopium goreaui TaxID=2562237 RepID=A0A9P1BI50_9DINO|nr:unnamed protein product [Cladocopium goreaui]